MLTPRPGEGRGGVERGRAGKEMGIAGSDGEGEQWMGKVGRVGGECGMLPVCSGLALLTLSSLVYFVGIMLYNNNVKLPTFVLAFVHREETVKIARTELNLTDLNKSTHAVIVPSPARPTSY